MGVAMARRTALVPQKSKQNSGHARLPFESLDGGGGFTGAPGTTRAIRLVCATPEPSLLARQSSWVALGPTPTGIGGPVPRGTVVQSGAVTTAKLAFR